ncbi:YncE family protein, partial [Bradyrhizobium sp.]|uniref:YncE family protein n=1 Tax=Bradyrhizobium sp. TaxID=376 RepID=UPI003C75A29E
MDFVDVAQSFAPECHQEASLAGREPGIALVPAKGAGWISRWSTVFGITLLCLGLPTCGGSGSGGPGAPADPPPTPSISFDPATTGFTSDRAHPTVKSNVILTLHNTTTAGLVLYGDYTKAAITGVDVDLRGPTLVPVFIYHRPPSTLFNGTYTDRLTIHTCRDQACTQPLAGSPLTIPITYTVTGTDPATGETGPPPDLEATPLPVQGRAALTHDVRDAEYSRSLDQIVMAATYPANALYVYDTSTGTEKSVPLTKQPTSVSVSPDGLSAAVGHEGLISVVDLAQVGQQPAHDPLLVKVSGTVFDLVLDGQGRVHFIPDTDQPGSIHTIDIATGTEELGALVPPVYGRTYARLHPSGSFLFVGDPLLSPSSID